LLRFRYTGGGQRLNKSGLIDAISDTTTLTKREAEVAINAFVHTVSSEVRAGRRGPLVGFGSFNPTQRGTRMGRNPQTGATLRFPSSKGVRFAPSSTLKSVMNGKAPLPSLRASRPLPRPAAPSVGAKALEETINQSTQKAVRRASARTVARRPAGRVTRRAPAPRVTTRAPASSAARMRAKRSANKAVGRASARTR
jgi:DNA-binding protein HU-beta